MRYENPKYYFDQSVYQARVYDGAAVPTRRPSCSSAQHRGLPAMQPLADNLLLCVASLITDPVTTTDELIPSGETSSYRSNPLRLAQFTLSARTRPMSAGPKRCRRSNRRAWTAPEITDDALLAAFAAARTIDGSATLANTGVGSVVYAVRPGDGLGARTGAPARKCWARLQILQRSTQPSATAPT